MPWVHWGDRNPGGSSPSIASAKEINWLLVKSKPATNVIPHVFILVFLANEKVRKAKGGNQKC